MNKKAFNFIQYIVFLGLGVFLVWWSIGKIAHKDWIDIKNAILGVNYSLIIPVLIALMLSHLSRAVRWKILMQPMGYTPSIANTYLAVLVGYLANLAVPRLGEILKCTLLARYEKVPADKLVGTIVAERAFDLVCLAIVFLITFFSQIDVIGDYAKESLINTFNKSNQFSWTKTLIVFVVIILFILLLRWVFKQFAHISIVKKTNEIVQNIWYGLTSIRHLKNKGWFIFHTVSIWLLYLVSIRMGMYAMKETNMYGLKESFSVLSMGSIGMIGTQGGIGLYPFMVQKTMMLYGLGENLAKAFGWLLWLVQFFMVLVFGALSLILLPAINRKKENE